MIEGGSLEVDDTITSLGLCFKNGKKLSIYMFYLNIEKIDNGTHFQLHQLQNLKFKIISLNEDFFQEILSNYINQLIF